ncbi:MAG: hypothetical protein EBX39_02360 [Actinobacteria bacterium]|nr:hypothetical protein [Actinomycetota bacterium]
MLWIVDDSAFSQRMAHFRPRGMSTVIHRFAPPRVCSGDDRPDDPTSSTGSRASSHRLLHRAAVRFDALIGSAVERWETRG